MPTTMLPSELSFDDLLSLVNSMLKLNPLTNQNICAIFNLPALRQQLNIPIR